MSKEVSKKEPQPHPCGECKWYDLSTQREFHRDGIRKGLVEIRAICRGEKSKEETTQEQVKPETKAK